MWAQFVSMGLGIWLMVAPAALHYGGAWADNDRIVGPIVVAFNCAAIWEVLRPLRWIGVPAGAWLLFAPPILGGNGAEILVSLFTGALLIGLAFVRGTVRSRFGGGWRSLLKPASPLT